MKLKNKYCNSLIEQGKVKENDVVNHSYTNNRIEDIDHRTTELNNIFPTMTTRPDCLGVVVKDDFLGTYQYAKSDTFMHGKDRFRGGRTWQIQF